MRYANISQFIVKCFCFILLFPGTVKAENALLNWETQLYGGEYYEDARIGVYSAVSNSFLNELSITGEILYEQYNDDSDYNFAGVGGHLMWEATAFAKFGVVASHSHEEYTFGQDFEDQELEVVSDTLGLALELDHDPITLAAQMGRVFNDTNSNDRYYLSMDVYYWGHEYLWYARGATRKARNYTEYTIEGYRTFFSDTLPMTLYVGATRNDLGTQEEIRTFHTKYDSVYTGSYFELLTTSSSTSTLWVEVAKQDEDTVFSVELNLTFGPGADAPYISAFGFTQ